MQGCRAHWKIGFSNELELFILYFQPRDQDARFFFYMCAFSCPIFSPLNMSIDLPGARWLWPIFRIYEGGMGHLLVFIWIQVHYIHNAFTDLEFSNITIFDHKMCFKNVGKG